MDVVLVHQEGAYDTAILEHCERVVHAPVDDGAAIIEALRPLHLERPFDRIMTTAEVAAVATGEAVDAFGLPGVGAYTARALKDKAETRELLRDRGLESVRFARIDDEADAVAFQREIDGPIVLKPADGAASLNINVVHDGAEACAAVGRLREAGSVAIIAEEYLEGPIVSIDSFSLDGVHVPVGYSQYRMNQRFVEWEISTPSCAAEPHLDELRRKTVELLDAVGLTEGPSHSEFVLTPHGARVLESHARLAGSGAPELVRRVFGVDLQRLMITVPLGIDPLPTGSPAPRCGAVARFLTPAPGVIEDVHLDERVNKIAAVRRIPEGERADVFLPFLQELRDQSSALVVSKNKGDEVAPLHTVADCDNGYVLASGRDREDAVAIAEKIASYVSFITRPTG